MPVYVHLVHPIEAIDLHTRPQQLVWFNSLNEETSILVGVVVKVHVEKMKLARLTKFYQISKLNK